MMPLLISARPRPRRLIGFVGRHERIQRRKGLLLRNRIVYLLARGAAALLVLLCVARPAHSASGDGETTNWVLQRGQQIPSRTQRMPQLRMEQQKLSGSTGCNSFTATLSDKGDKRMAIEQVALTRMLCAPAQNKIETAFVRALRETEYVQQKGKKLTFLSGKKQPLLVWARNHNSGKARSRKTAATRPASRKRYARTHHGQRAAVIHHRRRTTVDRQICPGHWSTVRPGAHGHSEHALKRAAWGNAPKRAARRGANNPWSDRMW